MKVAFVTTEELEQFGVELINKLTPLIIQNTYNSKAKWVKAAEAKLILNCADSTLQRLRIRNQIEFKKIGGSYYYIIP